jgi:hypothetical protein
MDVHAIDSLFPSSKIVKEPIIVLNKITTVTRARMVVRWFPLCRVGRAWRGWRHHPHVSPSSPESKRNRDICFTEMLTQGI